MKIKSIKLSLIAFVVCMGAFIFPCNVTEAADECSKELLLEYFPKQFVTETLTKFNIPQDKWEAITASLSNKDKAVVSIVEEKASKLTPNPLKDRDPQQRQVAVKIFRETLLQVFSDALQANGVKDSSGKPLDTKQLQAMLDDIQQQKAKNFAQCMEKQKEASQQIQSQPESSQQQEQSGQTDSQNKQSETNSEVQQESANSPQARLEGSEPSDLIADNDHQYDSDSSSDDDEDHHDSDANKE